MVFDGQLPVHFLDLCFFRIIWQTQDLIQVLLQSSGFVVENSLEDCITALSIRFAAASHLHALHFALILFCRHLSDDVQLVQARLTPQDVHLAILSGPLALATLAIPGRGIEASIFLELDVSPIVPIPFRSLHPRHILGDGVRDSLRPLWLLGTSTAAAHFEHTTIAHLEVKAASTTTTSTKCLPEELFNESISTRQRSQDN
mmetsp:Transcript_101979/g.264141  ORF Transcript_101979/g.264141 Transcript_101979/m.264141 type:complete len:202 (+) Transcript_101979:929-1534(+)